jgi:hypothetical protein
MPISKLDDTGISAFQRAFQDSGAIMFGAADSQTPDAAKPGDPNKYPRMPRYSRVDGNVDSSFVSRVDLFAWDNNVYTTTTP